MLAFGFQIRYWWLKAAIFQKSNKFHFGMVLLFERSMLWKSLLSSTSLKPINRARNAKVGGGEGAPSGLLLLPTGIKTLLHLLYFWSNISIFLTAHGHIVELFSGLTVATSSSINIFQLISWPRGGSSTKYQNNCHLSFHPSMNNSQDDTRSECHRQMTGRSTIWLFSYHAS